MTAGYLSLILRTGFLVSQTHGLSGYKLVSIGMVLYITVFRGPVIYVETYRGMLWYYGVCGFGMFRYFWVCCSQSFRKSGARPKLIFSFCNAGYTWVCWLSLNILSLFTCDWVCLSKFFDVFVCFCMLFSLRNIHHLSVHFSKSTLLKTSFFGLNK